MFLKQLRASLLPERQKENKKVLLPTQVRQQPVCQKAVQGIHQGVQEQLNALPLRSASSTLLSMHLWGKVEEILRFHKKL